MCPLFSDSCAFLASSPVLMYTFVAVFGLIIGSFLNVCIYRLPDETKSVVTPRSYCPSCKKTIAWFDNIPVLSWVLLGGKCRQCKAPISFRYVVVEIVTAAIFVLSLSVFGPTVYAFFMMYFLASLLVATVIDFQHKLIPDEITCYGMLVGLVVSYFFPDVHGEIDPRLAIADSVLGLLCGGGIVYIIAVVGSWVFKKEAMGGGDIKLLAMIGAFLGVKMTVIAFLLSPYLALVLALYAKFVKKEEMIPYGPFLSVGAVAAVFWGERILGWFS